MIGASSMIVSVSAGSARYCSDVREAARSPASKLSIVRKPVTFGGGSSVIGQRPTVPGVQPSW